MALGSWRTYERMPREEGLAVMRTARERGIDFLDDARYDDETGRAPIRSGYSEVVFGELFRAAGWARDEVIVSNKLWWEFWPEQSAAEELDASLGRMRLDHVDLIYAERPPAGLEMQELVDAVGGLISAGKARVWGVLNWPAAQIAEAVRAAPGLGVPPPCAAQLAYSLVSRTPVEDPAMLDALGEAGASVVASYVLAGGTLTGKYAEPAADGRMGGSRDDPAWRTAFRAGEELRALAAALGTTPAPLAIAFALANPAVCSALFGATSPAQVDEDLRAVELLHTLGGEDLSELRKIGDAG
jgi:aryl-alcohol dehydrogenase-like predicted oxidoreductase